MRNHAAAMNLRQLLLRNITIPGGRIALFHPVQKIAKVMTTTVVHQARRRRISVFCMISVCYPAPRKASVKNSGGVNTKSNRELFAIQENAMYNASFDEDCILTQIIIHHRQVSAGQNRNVGGVSVQL